VQKYNFLEISIAHISLHSETKTQPIETY